MKQRVEKTHQDIETDLYLFEFGIVAGDAHYTASTIFFSLVDRIFFLVNLCISFSKSLGFNYSQI